jgi:hypothetical protein
MNMHDENYTLPHERLDAPAVAVELDGAVVAIAHKADRGPAWIADQAMRQRERGAEPGRSPRP